MTDLDLTLSRLAADAAGADGGLHAAAADRVREECADPRGALLALVKAHKASDGPRLALAALLESEGQGERAEFIRVQVELAKMPEPGETTQGNLFPQTWEQERLSHCQACRKLNALCPYHLSCRRVRELWDIGTSGGGFLELPAGWGTPYWHRGFVAAVTCPAADWLAHADAVLAEHPVERVTLTTWPLIVWVETGRRRISGRALILDFGSEEAASNGDRVLPLLLEAEWPGVTFTLPPAEYTIAPAVVTRYTHCTTPVAPNAPALTAAAPHLPAVGWFIEFRPSMPATEYDLPAPRQAELVIELDGYPVATPGARIGPVDAVDRHRNGWRCRAVLERVEHDTDRGMTRYHAVSEGAVTAAPAA